MKLTIEQQKIVQQKLLDYLKDNPCSFCKSHHTWILNENVYELREFNGGNFILGGQSSIFPVIAITCQGCGNTHFFNAILLGLIKQNNEIGS